MHGIRVAEYGQRRDRLFQLLIRRLANYVRERFPAIKVEIEQSFQSTSDAEYRM